MDMQAQEGLGLVGTSPKKGDKMTQGWEQFPVRKVEVVQPGEEKGPAGPYCCL